MSIKNLLTVKEMQEYLGIGRAHAYRLVNIPDFPIIRIGNAIRIIRSELDDWIHNNIGNKIDVDHPRRK